MSKINTIVTHLKLHLDEITAIWLLQKFGEERFPGVNRSVVKFWPSGVKTPDGRSASEYEKEGILLVGVGGGRFDEHSFPDGKRKEGECATTLVAKELGVDEEETLQKILKFVVNSDSKGVGQPFDVAYIVKLLHWLYPNDPFSVMNWAFAALDAKYEEQVRFLTVTKEEFEKSAEVEEIVVAGGRSLRMVTITSDNEQISKYARSEAGGSAAVIVQKKSSGNVQIFTNKRYGLRLTEVVQMLRVEEQEMKKTANRVTDWRALSSEGAVKGIEEWYYFHEGEMLLNGSSTNPSAPPTRIPLEKIGEIVKIGINPDSFEPSRRAQCLLDKCTSTPRNPCPWYDWMLHRCRKVRFVTGGGRNSQSHIR